MKADVPHCVLDGEVFAPPARPRRSRRGDFSEVSSRDGVKSSLSQIVSLESGAGHFAYPRRSEVVTDNGPAMKSRRPITMSDNNCPPGTRSFRTGLEAIAVKVASIAGIAALEDTDLLEQAAAEAGDLKRHMAWASPSHTAR